MELMVGKMRFVVENQRSEQTNCVVFENERGVERVSKTLSINISQNCCHCPVSSSFFELLIGALHTLSTLSTFVVVAVVSLVASVSVWGKVFDHDLFGVVVHLSFRYGWGG